MGNTLKQLPAEIRNIIFGEAGKEAVVAVMQTSKEMKEEGGKIQAINKKLKKLIAKLTLGEEVVIDYVDVMERFIKDLKASPKNLYEGEAFGKVNDFFDAMTAAVKKAEAKLKVLSIGGGDKKSLREIAGILDKIEDQITKGNKYQQELVALCKKK
jgi:hypothetical protein